MVVRVFAANGCTSWAQRHVRLESRSVWPHFPTAVWPAGTLTLSYPPGTLMRPAKADFFACPIDRQ